MALFVAFQVEAREVLTLKEGSQRDVASFTLIAESAGWKDSLVYAGAYDTKFKPLSSWQQSVSTDTDYWMLLEVTGAPNTTPTDWVLKFDLSITDLTAYVVKVDQSTKVHHSGHFLPNEWKSFAPTTKANLVQLGMIGEEIVRIYVRVAGTRKFMPPRFNMEVLSLDSFYSNLRKKKQANAFYQGFVIMMLVFNVFAFGFKKDNATIYYSLYLFFIALFAAYNSGDLSDWIQDLVIPNQPMKMYYFKLSSYLGLVCYVGFIRAFLDLRQLLPKWDRGLKYFCYLALPFAITDLVLMHLSNFSPNVSDYATISYAIIFLLLTFTVIWPIRRSSDGKRNFIFWGVIAMSIGIAITIFARFQSYDFSAVAFKIGSIVEILIFSIGLVYRQREIEIGRKSALFALERSRIKQEQERTEKLRLQELDDFKKRVYTNITHEFRTPLSVIKGISEQIEGHQEEKDMIDRNSEQLLQLINQILDLSKLQENKLELVYKEGDVLEYISYLFESLTSYAQEKNISLKLRSTFSQLWMQYDEKVIQYIVHNLLSNAIKFTADQGHVALDLSVVLIDGQQHLEIAVSDDGIGIASENIKQIFDRFYQSPEALKMASRGTGIGLALVKELVEQCEGKITVESTLNQGSLFRVCLPLRAGANLAEKETIKNFVPAALDTGGAGDEVSDKPLILLVEDNADVMTYLTKSLANEYQVLKAYHGKAGFDLAIAHIPDLIITDVRMPQMDGIELTNLIKDDKRTCHIPVVILTARADKEPRLLALEHGADAYLQKPFEREELHIRIRKLIELKAKLQTYYGLTSSSEIEKPADRFLQELDNYIGQNLENAELTIEDMMVAMGVSRTQLFRKVKALTNMSGMQYLAAVRLEEGKRLLATELTISQIAYRVGFSDPNYFSRRFMQAYQMSPTQYREKFVKQQS